MNNKSARTNEELTNTNNSLRELNQQLLSEIAERKRIEEALTESEAHFRTLANNGQALIWTSGTDKKCNYFNQPWLDFTGRALEEEIGDGWTEGVHPDDFDHCVSTYINAFEKREKFSMEYRVRHNSGEYRWIQDDGTPRYNSKGEFIGYIGHCLDIQERKLMDIELQESKKLFSKAEAIGHVGSWEYNFQTKQFWASTEAKLIYGFAPEIDNFSIEEVESCIPEHKQIHQALVNLIEKGGKYEQEFEIITRNTTEPKTIVSIAELESDADGKPHSIVGVLQDITLRKKAERALQESETRFRNFVENANDIIFSLSPDGIFTYISPNWTEKLGHNTNETIGQSITKFIHPEDLPNCKAAINKAKEFTGEKQEEIEYRVQHKNGSWRWHSSNNSTLRNSNGEVTLLLGIAHDINDRKLVELELFESEEKYRNLVEASMDAIYMSLEEKIIYLNPAALKLFGAQKPEQIIGKTPVDIIHPDFHNFVRERMNILRIDKIQVRILEAKVVQLNGNIIDVEVAASPFSFKGQHAIQVVMRDISERKQFERSLIESKALYHSFVEHLPASVFRKDKNGRYVFVNSMFCKLKGLSEKEIIGLTPCELQEYESKNKGDNPYGIMGVQYNLDNQGVFQHEQIMNTGLPIEQIEQYPQPDGTTLYFQVIKSPVFDAEGKAIGSQGVQFDITERILAEEKVRESEQLFSNIFYNSPVSICITSRDNGKIIDANKVFLKDLGFTSQDIIGKPIADIGIFNDQIYRDQLISKLIKDGSVSMFECPFKTKTGRIMHGLMSMSSILYKGKPHQLTTVIDITDRKLAEIKLLESERLLTESQRISGIGSYTLDIEKGLWSGSIVLDEMFGISPTDDHSVAGWLAIVHSEDKEMMDNYFSTKIIADKGRFDKEYRIVPKNNPSTFKWVHGIGEIELSSSGAPIKMIGTIQDITERKKTEDELLKLTRAIEQSPDTVVITNTKGEIEYANPIIEGKTGYSLSELVGQNSRIFSSGHTSKKEYAEMWKTISSGQIWQGEFLNKKKNGELFWESTTISPVYDNNGIASHYLAIKEDITLQKKMTQELIEAKEKAEESDRLKSAFLANMSHEIRTPLNSIIGFASLIPDEKSLDLISTYAQIVVQNSEQLVSLIDGIVLYSKLQTHLMSYQPTLFNAGKLLHDVQVSFALPEYSKDVELRTEIYDEIQLLSDYDKIRQILSNLISNAFKYTKKGSIIVGCKSAGDEIKFWVRDSGIGIPENEKTKIFDRFFRGSNVDLARSRGTGLGLSIVKELVELLNGKIWAESEEGKGSTFYFTIPQKKEIN